jgi:hypothetical protein
LTPIRKTGLKRKIVSRRRTFVENFGRPGFRVVLSLECGHEKRTTGGNEPKTFSYCEECTSPEFDRLRILSLDKRA